MTSTTPESSSPGVATAGAGGPLFVRQATGLVKGWSARDASLYSFFAISIGAIGFYTFSTAVFIPGGSLVWAIVITTVFLLLQVFIYGALITLMPRAGGDYVWQTRLLHGSIGFVIATAGWWFIMWHVVPLYGDWLVSQVLGPLMGVVGAPSVAEWLATKDGVFVSSLAVIAIASGWVIIGLGGYAKVQRYCVYFGGLALLTVFALLLFGSKGDFTNAFNREAASQFGAGPDAYQKTVEVGGFDTVGLDFPFSGTFLLVPLVLFWNIWIIWGATLAGEIRGARDMRKNVTAMGGALVGAAVLALVFFALVSKTMGWDFYNAANNAYWGSAYGTLDDVPLTQYPSPFMFVAWMVDNPVFQFVLILLGAAWLLGLMGTVFLSSTRVIFAAAFDRVLPEAVAKVSTKHRVPWVALLLMMGPSVVVSALYAYWGDFATYTLDILLLGAVTYLTTAVAAAILPWRAPRLYQASPLARMQVGGIPLITICSIVFAGFLVFCLYHWLKDDVYGVNNSRSLVYLAILYGLATTMYIVARVVRARQGIGLSRVHAEIPVD